HRDETEEVQQGTGIKKFRDEINHFVFHLERLRHSCVNSTQTLKEFNSITLLCHFACRALAIISPAPSDNSSCKDCSFLPVAITFLFGLMNAGNSQIRGYIMLSKTFLCIVIQPRLIPNSFQIHSKFFPDSVCSFGL